MSNGVYLNLPHKIDVYIKTSTTNAAGQRAVTYSKSGTIQAQYQAVSSDKRTFPYVVLRKRRLNWQPSLPIRTPGLRP